MASRRVFIIHGRNQRAVAELSKFLRAIGLEPWLFEQVSDSLGPNPIIEDVVWKGLTSSAATIALFTPDESAWLRVDYERENDTETDRARWQARPNVLYETGLAHGWNKASTGTRNFVLMLLIGPAIHLPSDFDGHLKFRVTNHPEQRRRLREHFVNAGCEVNADEVSFLDLAHGDFDEAVLVGALAKSPGANRPNDEGDASYLLACCDWLPVLRQIERTALDLLESENYINRPPSSAEDMRRQIRDINHAVRLYNGAVDAVKHHARRHEDSLRRTSDSQSRWVELNRGLALAKEFERCPQWPSSSLANISANDGRALNRLHGEVLKWFAGQRRQLTKNRDGLLVALQRICDEIRRQVAMGVPARVSEARDAALRVSLSELLSRYFDDVTAVYSALQQPFDATQEDREPFHLWLSALIVVSEELNQCVPYLQDRGLIGVIECVSDGLPLGRAVALVQLIEDVLGFHKNRVRLALNNALVPVYELDEDATASVQGCLENVAGVLDEYRNAFEVELPDYRQRAREMFLE